MRMYGVVVRTLVVGLAGALLIEGTPAGQELKGLLGLRGVSNDLLYGKDSPFQNSALQNLEETNNPSAEAATRLAAEMSAPTHETFTHTIKRGTTLSTLWRDLKGAPHALHSFISAFSNKRSSLKAGEVVSVTKKGDEILELRRDLGAGATLIVSPDSEGRYVPRVEQATISVRERKVTGTIMSSLVDAAKGVQLSYAVVDDFVDLFGSRVEFRKDLQPGDSFTVTFDERVLEDGRVLENGPIKAASLSLSGELYAVVRDVAQDGTVRYFDEKGEMPTKAFLRYPVQFTRISSVFSTARFHPVLHISRPHNGVDYSAPIGTPVRTVSDGVVVHAGYSSSTGNMIRISHDSRYTTEYMHLSKIAPSVRKGARVQRGAVIGNVGNTGLSSGPHLHFGLFDHGKYIDPMKAKVIQSAPAIKAPKAVLAMIDEMRKTHRTIAVASSNNSKKKA